MKKKSKKKFGWGGARAGAGRPRSPDSGAPHTTRLDVKRGQPVLLTLVASPLIDFHFDGDSVFFREVFEKSQGRFGCRFERYAIHDGTIYVVARAPNSESLSKGAQGLSVRIARGINRIYGSSRKVFGDRYSVTMLEKDENIDRRPEFKVAKRYLGP